MKIQFEKLEKSENLEFLRDLLYEFMDLVIDEYENVVNSIDHNDCESFASFMNLEYKIINFDLFQISSQFILKSIPLLNKKMCLSPFICYSEGSCKGYLSHTQEKKNTILLIKNPSDFLKLESETVGIIIVSTTNIFANFLLCAKSKKIPVAIGFFPPADSEVYELSITESLCKFEKI